MTTPNTAPQDLYAMPDDVPAEVRKSLGFLRQWLNEERITDPTKMVSNKVLWHWLSQALKDIDTCARKEGANAAVDHMKSSLDGRQLYYPKLNNEYRVQKGVLDEIFKKARNLTNT